MRKSFVLFLFGLFALTAAVAMSPRTRSRAQPTLGPPTVQAPPPPAAAAQTVATDDDDAQPMETVPTREFSAAELAAHRDAYDALHRRIEDAKKLLKNAPLSSNAIGGDNAVLAIWDPVARGDIRLVTVIGGKCRSKKCDVSVLVPNGVNTRYRVNAPDGHIVIALKTNVRDAVRKRAVRKAVYVPYSPELQTAANVAAGRAYLDDLVRRGTESLNRRGVHSLVDSGLRPTDTVPPQVLRALLVVEHMDPDDFARDGVEQSVGKVLTVLATNREDAYRYAVSYAKARGLAQFIQTTYDLTRGRYPKAELPASFIDGMTDHVSAVRAQYCLSDWSITRLADDDRARLRRHGNEIELGAYLAAAYNGGENLASRCVANDPHRWECAGGGLFTQTVRYVKTFRATYKYLATH